MIGWMEWFREIFDKNLRNILDICFSLRGEEFINV